MLIATLIASQCAFKPVSCVLSCEIIMCHLLHLANVVQISSWLGITSMLTLNVNYKICKMASYKTSKLLLCSNIPLLFLFQISSLFSVGNCKWCLEFCFNLWECCLPSPSLPPSSSLFLSQMRCFSISEN